MARRINAKLVLELLGRGMSGREIYRSRRIAQQSAKKVRDAARQKGVSWEDVSTMGEKQVYDLLFPERAEIEDAAAQVDYDYVHHELQRDGVTLLILWEEYRDQAIAEELVPKSYTTFCRGYRRYVTSRNVTNHLEYKPGQVMDAAPMRPAPCQANPIFAQAPVQGRDVNFSTTVPAQPTPRLRARRPPGTRSRAAIGWSRGHGKASKTSYCPTYRIVLL